MKDFHNLKVWEKAHQLTLDIYQETRTYPRDELFGITGQMRRAATSIPANIAEGCGRNSDADLSRFLIIALGSACELEYLITLSRDLKYINNVKYKTLIKQISEVKKMLSKFILKLKADS